MVIVWNFGTLVT